MHYHRNTRDEDVQYLATTFPRCFSAEPRQRQPLKRDILADLEKENVLNPDRLEQALNWYTDDFAYRYSLLPGADRLDLNGNKAGTVTPQEHREARNWVAARKRELKERQDNLRATLTASVAATTTNKINGAHVTKAAPTSHPLLPQLADMTSAIAVVRTVLTENQFEALRPALAAAALREVIAHAETLIGELGLDSRKPNPF